MTVFIVSYHGYDHCGWPTHNVIGVYDSLANAAAQVKSDDQDNYDIDEYMVNGDVVDWHMERGGWNSDAGRAYANLKSH